MCDPFTLAIGSAAVGAASSLAQGMAASSAHRANASMLEIQARQREEKAEFDARNARNKYQKVRGAQMVGAASTGLDIASFSDVMEDSALESGLEIKAIRFGAKNEAFQLRYQAQAERSKASAATVGGVLGAVGAGLKGFGSIQSSFGTPSASVSVSSPWATTVTRA